MASKIFLSVGLILSLGCSLAFGCGSSQEVTYDSHFSGSTNRYLEAPEQVVAQLGNCANQGAERLTLSSYAILIDVNVTEDGRVRGVKIKDSMIGDAGIESCMVSALQSASLPTSVMRLRSVSKDVARESRAFVGNPAV